MIELRLRTRAHPDTLAVQAGKLLTDTDYDLLLTGRSRVLKPDGRPLALYLPGALSGVLEKHPDVYDILHSLRTAKTENRGLASGTRRIPVKGQKRTYARPVASALVGAADPMGIWRYCRLTAWTGSHLPEYTRLRVLLEAMAEQFAAHVPDRYLVQDDYASRTHADWVIPGTPYTTITVNNTYATGTHTDAGDLAAGFSCLAVIRRGNYTGGRLVFPEWRTAVDLVDGDLLLMDAHDWHGNTEITCPHAAGAAVRSCEHCHGERISVVAYYRERMAACGSASEEQARALADAERRSSKGGGDG